MIKLYSASWCTQCTMAKQMLMQNCMEYELVDVDVNDAAAAKLEAAGIKSLPVLEADELAGEKLYVGIKEIKEFIRVRTV